MLCAYALPQQLGYHFVILLCPGTESVLTAQLPTRIFLANIITTCLGREMFHDKTVQAKSQRRNPDREVPAFRGQRTYFQRARPMEKWALEPGRMESFLAHWAPRVSAGRGGAGKWPRVQALESGSHEAFSGHTSFFMSLSLDLSPAGLGSSPGQGTPFETTPWLGA